MKVTYLYHSGFIVEEADTVLVFDYFKGDLPDFDKNKEIYMFASHRHYDHFKKKIYKWKDYYPKITYILSDDIPSKKYMDHTVFIGPDSEREIGSIKVRTLKSTDEGVAFFVRFKGKTVYHAGDLNWWHWEEEGNVYNEMMKRNYQYEINKIAGAHIDVAFVPVDPRLGDQFYYGLDWLMRHTYTDYVFPMHFWEKYEVCEQIRELPEAAGYRNKIADITTEYQVFRCD